MWVRLSRNVWVGRDIYHFCGIIWNVARNPEYETFSLAGEKGFMRNLDHETFFKLTKK
jgi:hypothetical protein